MTRKRTIRVVVLFGALGLAALLAGLCYFAAQGSSSTMVLTNGTRITVLGISRGGESFTTEKRWHQLARKLLPARWQGWIPTPLSGSATGASNSLTVWLKAEAANGTSLLPSSASWDHCYCVCDDGSKLPAAWHVSLSGAWSFVVGSSTMSFPATTLTNVSLISSFPANLKLKLPSALYSLECDSLPRRQAEFRLDFYTTYGVLLGSLKVRNPFNRAFPEWRPEPLPITRTNGPMTVVLTQVSKYKNGAASPITLEPRFDFSSEGPDWRFPTRLIEEWSDATGNTGPALPGTERAWKLDVWYRQSVRPEILPEKVVVSGLQPPGPGRFQLLTNESRGQDWRVQVRCAAGPGLLVLTNNAGFGMYPPSQIRTTMKFGYSNASQHGTLEWPSANPFVLVESSPARPPSELHFRAFEPGGAEILLATRGSSGLTPDSDWWLVEFVELAPTNAFSLEVSFYPARHFEFFVNPAAVQTRN